METPISGCSDLRDSRIFFIMDTWLLKRKTMKEKFLAGLNWVLTVNTFLVLLSFFWLAIAVIGHALHLPLGLELWYKLWEPVFTPAIGLLMGGALLSGLIGWLNKSLNLQ